MAVLVWVPAKKRFLKIQEGTGDNLTPEDVAQGNRDYVLWNVYSVGVIDVDEEWNPSHEDGGMLLFPSEISAIDSLSSVYECAFGETWDESKTIVLHC